MGELVRVDLDVLPSEPAYRPVGRAAWYARTIPTALGIGATAGLLTAWASPLLLWGAVAGFLGWSVLRRRRMYGYLRDNDDGVAMLVAGDLDEATRVFDELCHRCRSMPVLHSLFVYNRAVAHLESGELERSIALLSAVLHAGWIGHRGALSVHYPAVLGRLAVAEALLGRVEQADGWRARAHAATSAPKRGALLFVDAVVESRLGHFDRVVEIVEDGLPRAENLVTARQLRSIRLLQAFALERLSSSDYRAVSRETDFQRTLQILREGRRGEHDFLAAAWDELAGFLRRHGLDARP
jgi:hypothetical protein